MFRYILIICCLFWAGSSHAQGTVRGKIVDPNGDPIIGAKVMFADTSGFLGKTDIDGL
ncbi:MAG: hypothetical protein RL138_1151, partial [Bacteroidota bacterium]